jgi:hypothetical protein
MYTFLEGCSLKLQILKESEQLLDFLKNYASIAISMTVSKSCAARVLLREVVKLAAPTEQVLVS